MEHLQVNTMDNTSTDRWILIIGIVGTIVTAVIAGFRMLYKDKIKSDQAHIECERARARESKERADELKKAIGEDRP